MTIEIEVPGHGVVEFPDGTNQATMEKALQTRFSPSAGDVATDVAKSGGVGVGKGILQALGSFGDADAIIQKGASKGVSALAPYIGDEAAAKLQEATKSIPSTAAIINPMHLLVRPQTSEQLQKGVEDNFTGEFYKPQTTAGKYAQTVGEFLPSAVVGPTNGVRSLLRNATVFGVAPGLTSEGAGQLSEGKPSSPFWRSAAAMTTTLAGALATRPSTLARNVGKAADGATPAQLSDAEQLFQDARAAGTPITRFEAIQAATNGATRAGDVQRVIEGQGGLKRFFAQRPARNDAAAQEAFNTAAPANTPAATTMRLAPETVGPAVGEAAEGTINDVRDAINTAAAPHYQQAELDLLTPRDMRRARAVPGYDEAVTAIQRDPQLARYVTGLPEESVGFQNEVKKYLDTQATNATGVMAQNPNLQRAAGYRQDAGTIRQIGIDNSTEYETALALEAFGRENALKPLQDGLLGRLAKKDTTTAQAINTLFPRNPLPNSAQEITIAVSNLAQRNPTAARELVRAHLESTFNQVTRDLQGGANQFGGAGFAAAVRGNAQQAENLEAAMRALPNGDQTWAGFSRFLDIMSAQGQRQRIGSQTAFNQTMQDELRKGGTTGTAMALASGAGLQLPRKAMDVLAGWRLGRNVDELAKIATDPTAGAKFRRLAATPQGSAAAWATFGHILSMAAPTGDRRKNAVGGS